MGTTVILAHLALDGSEPLSVKSGREVHMQGACRTVSVSLVVLMS